MPPALKRKIVIFLTSLSANTIKKLAETPVGESVTTWVTVLKTGKYWDPRYEWFDITTDMLSAMVLSFKSNATRLEVPLKFGHYGPDNAAGWFKELSVDGNRLRALVEWTPPGITSVRNKEFKYISAEYDENFQDNITGTNIGCVFEGGALTNKPVIRDQEPLMLSQKLGPDDQFRVAIHPELAKQLNENPMEELEMKEFLKMLLAASGLPEDEQKKLLAALDPKVKDDSKQADVFKLANDAIEVSRKKLATPPPEPAPASAPEPAPVAPPAPVDPAKKLTQVDVDDAVKLAMDNAATEAKKLADARQSHIDGFAKRLDEQDGLNDDTKKQLSEDFTEFVNGEMPQKMVDRFADSAIKLAEQSIANQKLLADGFEIHGKVMITDEKEKVRALAICDDLEKELLSVKSLSERYPETQGNISGRQKKFRDDVIALYDRVHMPRLLAEGNAHLRQNKRMLASGDQGVGDTPIGTGGLVSINRTVLFEALTDMAVMGVYNTELAENLQSTVVEIYFDERDPATRPDMDVYEGEAVPYAGASVDSESFQVTPKKLATKLSNELMFFGQRMGINWRAIDRHLMVLTEHRKELISDKLVNEMILANDEFGAVQVVGEDLGAQTNAANTTFQLANYPLVPIRQVKDIKGSVLSTANAFVITYKGGALTEYDGTGTQAPGDYYKITSYALGQYQIVDEAGAVQTPAGADALTTTYYYATNVAIFDTKFVAGSWEDHLNGLLNLFGDVKAGHYMDRFVKPDYGFSAVSLNETITHASNWTPDKRIEGQGLDSDGNLARIKGVPQFGTNALGQFLGEKRMILGRRGTNGYTIVKPWQQEAGWQEVLNGSGAFVGKKQTYFEEYSAIGTPTPIKGYNTSILARHSDDDIGPF